MDEPNRDSDPNAELPSGIYGYFAAEPSGSVIERHGKIMHSLDEFAPYFKQLSDLVADGLGFGEAEELILFGKRVNAISLEADNICYGASVKPKGDLKEISRFLREKGDEDDVLA